MPPTPPAGSDDPGDDDDVVETVEHLPEPDPYENGDSRADPYWGESK